MLAHYEKNKQKPLQSVKVKYQLLFTRMWISSLICIDLVVFLLVGCTEKYLPKDFYVKANTVVKK